MVGLLGLSSRIIPTVTTGGAATGSAIPAYEHQPTKRHSHRGRRHGLRRLRVLRRRFRADPEPRPPRRGGGILPAALLCVADLRAGKGGAAHGALPASDRSGHTARDPRSGPDRPSRGDRRRRVSRGGLQDEPRRKVAQRNVRSPLRAQRPRIRRVHRILRRMVGLLPVPLAPQRHSRAVRRSLSDRPAHAGGDRLHQEEQAPALLPVCSLQCAALAVPGSRQVDRPRTGSAGSAGSSPPRTQ